MSTEAKSSDNLFAGIKAGAVASASPVEPEAPAVPEVEDAPAPQMSELDMLKNRARLMGLTFSNNISVDTLRKKIQDKLDGEEEAVAEEQDQDESQEADQEQAAGPSAEQIAAAQAILEAAGLSTANANVDPTPSAVDHKPAGASAKETLRDRIYRENMALVRLRITNLDPKKKDLPGEIFTVANEYLGSVRKFIPYGEVTDNGYHVPVCIYKQLQDRQFLNIKVTKGSNGRERIEHNWAREFSLEVLEPLTTKELAQLAAAQAAAAGIGEL